jgi:hypothetical protein
MKRLVTAVIGLAVILVARFWPQPDSIPLFNLTTGVNVVHANGRTLFVDKEGLNITVLSSIDPAGGRSLVFCTGEGVYLDPANGLLYDSSGRWLEGSPRADVRRYPTTIDPTYRLHIGKKPLPPTRARGFASIDVLQLYRVWRINSGAHFCESRIVP